MNKSKCIYSKALNTLLLQETDKKFSNLGSLSVSSVVKPCGTIQAKTQSERAHKPIISFLTLSGHAFYFVRVTQVYLKIWVGIITEG